MLWRARARFHLTCSFDRSSFFLLASPFAGNGIGYATASVLCEPKWAESFLRSKTSAVALRVAANAKATFDLEAVALCRDRLVFLSSSKRSSFLGCLEIGECGCHCIRAPVCALQAQRLSTFWVPSSSWSCFGCFILSHEQNSKSLSCHPLLLLCWHDELFTQDLTPTSRRSNLCILKLPKRFGG